MSRPSPLRPADQYHTGVVVDDLASAKERIGTQLGVTWLEGGALVRILSDSGERIEKTASALSVEGPLHVELEQSVPGTLFTTTGDNHLHHIGYWVDEVASVSAAPSHLAMPKAAMICVGEGTDAPIRAYHEPGDDYDVEIVSRATEAGAVREASVAQPSPVNMEMTLTYYDVEADNEDSGRDAAQALPSARRGVVA